MDIVWRHHPSGRLPLIFPASLDQLPRPKLDSSDTIEPDFQGKGQPGQTLGADYDIEGSGLGFRWNARKGQKALFPFGHGLSYTKFETAGLKIKGTTATFTVRNVGAREGASVAQLYMVLGPDGAAQRLAAFTKISLKPGESRTLTLPIEKRVVANWIDRGWQIKAGDYGFALGDDAEHLGPVTQFRFGTTHCGP